MRVAALVLALTGGSAALVGALMVSPNPSGALEITSDGPSLPGTLIGLMAATTALASAMVALRSRYLTALALVLMAATAQLVAIRAAGAQPLPVGTADAISLGILIACGLVLGGLAVRRRLRPRIAISA
jgi:hypothetical protein